MGLLLKSKQEVNVLLLGLDCAGKTTLMRQMAGQKLNQDEDECENSHEISTIPQNGFHVEKIKLSNCKLQVWDVGGQQKVRNLWQFYFQHTHVVIFVVDSSDSARLAEAADVFKTTINQQELMQASFIVVCNKTDLPECLTTDTIVNSFGLTSATKRNWSIVSLSAKSGQGIKDLISLLDVRKNN